MCERVVRVGNLEEFRQEVPPSTVVTRQWGTEVNVDVLSASVVRLTAIERWVESQIPQKRLELHLQGFNDLGELVWLMHQQRVTWFSGGPESPVDRSLHTGMSVLEDLVREHLIGLGYEVRAGSYGLAKDVEPVQGVFECARWDKDGQDGYRVVAVEEAASEEQEVEGC